MAEPITSYNIENDAAFRNALDEAAKHINDFRVPFNLIANDFYKSERAIFKLKSAGGYPDLSTKPFRAFWSNVRGYAALYEGGSKQYKKENVGFEYPILVGKTGRLAASLTNKNHPDADFFIGQKVLILGTKVPYAIYHQSDQPRKKIPQRKMVFIEQEARTPNSAAGVGGRKVRWLGIINDYVKGVIGE